MHGRFGSHCVIAQHERRRMMKSVLLIFCVCIAIGSLAAAGVCETLTVSSLDESGVWSDVLSDGVTYMFEASGTYCFDLSSGRIADAEWCQENGTSEEVWLECEYGNTEAGDFLDLGINDVLMNWCGSADGLNWTTHTYSPNHIYRYYFVGIGERVNFRIFDGNVEDNSGSLSVAITPAVPEPTSVITLFGGLASLIFLRRRA